MYGRWGHAVLSAPVEEDSLWKSVFFHYMGSGDQTQVLRLGGKFFSPETHLVGPGYAGILKDWLYNWFLSSSISTNTNNVGSGCFVQTMPQWITLHFTDASTFQEAGWAQG